MMHEEIDAADAPPDIEELVQGHLNTSRFLGKGWLRVTAALAVGLPLALIARGTPIAGALFTAAVVCAIVGGVLRLGVHVLQQIRARQVATEIAQRVPQDHPGRESVDRWLMRRNRRGDLTAVLQELSGGELGSSTPEEPGPPASVSLSRTSRRPVHLPLELDEFEPDDSPRPVGATRRGRTPV